MVLTRDGGGRLLKEESRCGHQAPFPFAEVLENTPPEERAEAAAVFAKLFSPHKAMWSTTYDYDDRGRQIGRITMMAGVSEDQTTWEYDEHDNPIRELHERTSGELRADESGNLRKFATVLFGCRQQRDLPAVYSEAVCLRVTLPSGS